MQRIGLALARRPKLVDEGENRASAAAGCDLAGGLPEFAETGKFGGEINRPWAGQAAVRRTQSRQVGLGEALRHGVGDETNDCYSQQASKPLGGFQKTLAYPETFRFTA